MPLLGDCWAPSALVAWPARQPTAASTAPGWAFSPEVFALAGPCTTTSVTTLARKQSLAVTGCPWQSPVGRSTFVKLAPASVDRNRPPPVAAYTRSGCVWSTASLKPSTPSGTPAACVQFAPRSVVR